MTRRDGHGKTVTLQPRETITPGQDWEGTCEYLEEPARENQEPLSPFIRRATVADAAGHQREYGPTEAGGPASSGGRATDGTTARGG